MKKKVHFIGIGGISMSGLAEIMLDSGFNVTGSDLNESKITDKLVGKGVQFFKGHNSDNISQLINSGGIDLVVYTAAINKDNPELVKANKEGIQVIERKDLLGEIMKQYKFNVAVAGTHGKTTTTSMISTIMLEAKKDPTIHVGGELKNISGSTKIGSKDFFITEACEYVESFLKLTPTMGVILNIEEDHLDYFNGIDHIKESFLKFARIIPKYGYIVACLDDPNVACLLDRVECNIITYGIASENAMWKASDIKYHENNHTEFNVFKDGKKLGNIKLKIPGMHNVSNALAAIAACYTVGCDMDSIIRGIGDFSGASRRFELKSEVNGVKIIDDYAHHPSEITATLGSIKKQDRSRLWCVFQPHTYTRTKHLINEFSEAFSSADKVLIVDIYAAREVDTKEISSKDLVKKLQQNKVDVRYIPDFNNIVKHLTQNVSDGDIVITIGAGNIYIVGEMLAKELQKS